MNKRGFTLIELLIVIAIIGIIAAIAIPNLMMAINKGRQKRSMGDIHTIGTGISSFILDTGNLPAFMSAGGVGPLQYPAMVAFNTVDTPDLVPFHMSQTVNTDAWDRSYWYGFTGSIVTGDMVLLIGSGGADIIFDWHGAGSGAAGAGNFYNVDDLSDFAYDIVFAQGQMAYGPASALST